MPRRGQYKSNASWTEPDHIKIKRLESELEHLRMAAIVQPMVDRFAHNLATLLVHGKAYKDWSHTERLALNEAFGNAHVARAWFLGSLPLK